VLEPSSASDSSLLGISQSVAPVEELPAQPDEQRPLCGVRLLAAEDNEANQEVLFGIADYLGFSITIVGNGRDALNELNSERKYDIVLMDCQMPIMDGYNAARAIRQLEARRLLPHIPIIAVTAHALPGEREKVLEAGMDDYMTKPLDVGELQDRIERWLSRDKPAPSLRAAGATPSDIAEVLDLAAVAQLKLLQSPKRPRFLVDLIEKYASEAVSVVASIKAAAADADAILLQERAHLLKGSSRALGATQVAALCSQIELLSKSDSAQIEVTLLTELERSIERAVALLRKVADDDAPMHPGMPSIH
jgi:two-component system sensor histidine kinase/response regulator